MEKKKIGFNFKGKRINLIVKVCRGFNVFKGLMFSKKENAEALIFEFRKSTRQGIHSLFVFYDFIAIWLDDKNKIVEVRRVKPFEFFVRPKKNFRKLVEVPINRRYDFVVGVFDGDRKV